MYQVGFMQPPPRHLCPGRCTQRVKRGPKKADCPAFDAGSMPRAPFPQQRPEASETPAGALGTTLCTYRSVRSSRRPVVLFPWRCTWKSRPKKPIALPLVLDYRPMPSAKGPRNLTHLPGPWGPLCTRTRSVLCSRRPVVCALADAHRGSKFTLRLLPNHCTTFARVHLWRVQPHGCTNGAYLGCWPQ
jgi:hypothetical protein